MHDDFRPLDVLEKRVAEARAVLRAFDQAGDIGDDDAAIADELGDAELRLERGERIIGDLRAGPRRSR